MASPTGGEPSAVLSPGPPVSWAGHLPVLAKAGPFRCLVRDPERLAEAHRKGAVEADLGDPDSLAPALEGMQIVYYLVHSMEPGRW